MAAFEGMSTGSIFGIVFGILTGAVFIAGCITLAWSKRKLGKDTKKDGLEAPMRSDQEKLVPRAAGEGSLLGERAMEHKDFVSVTQSRPSSPVPSYILSPDTAVVDWSKSGQLEGHSASSSTTSLPRSLAPSSLNHTKRKPSPLSLQPPNPYPSVIDGLGGSLLPSPRSLSSFKGISPTNYTFDQGGNIGWVSPLDVHFSRPLTPKVRPTSFLPKLKFPGEIEKTGLFVPMPSNSAEHIKSESASIVSDTSSIAAPHPPRRSSRPKTPRLSVFPPALPSRASRGGARSIFPMADDQDRPSTRRGPKEGNLIPQSVPLNDLAPQTAVVDESYFPKDTRDWSPTSPKQSSPPKAQWDPTSPTFPGPIHCNDGFSPSEPVIRDPVAISQRVSVCQPSHVRTSSAGALEMRRSHLSTSSSIYSTRTSILDDKNNPSPSDRPRSRSQSSLRAENRSTSADTITRPQRDSVHQHNRTKSSETLKNRRSRDHGQIHHDSTSADRTRSGSVQGRDNDLNSQRESPVSNSNTIHDSPNSTIKPSSSSKSSYYNTTEDMPTIPQFPPIPPQLVLPVLVPKSERLRSESVTSQGSVSDLYDAYYRQSMMGKRASAAHSAPVTNMPGSRNLSVNPGLQGGNGRIVRDGGSRRPLPLRVGDTIMEVVSPYPSPMAPKQEAPNMI